jgi:hypothetical protein
MAGDSLSTKIWNMQAGLPIPQPPKREIYHSKLESCKPTDRGIPGLVGFVSQKQQIRRQHWPSIFATARPIRARQFSPWPTRTAVE